MASTIEQIMGGVRDRLATISGLTAYDYKPSTVNVPAGLVQLPNSINYHSTSGRGKIELTFTALVVVSTTSDESGQKQLSSYLDPTGATSVVTAIESDKTLGGLVDYCIVSQVVSGDLERFGLADYYGAAFELSVVSSGV